MNNQENPRSIREWMNIFSELYSQVDSNRTPEQIWMANVAHASTIGESIRLFTLQRLLKNAAHFLCWLCSFINKCNTTDDVYSFAESLHSIICLKYPTVCGHCKQATCQCDPIRMDRSEDKKSDYVDLLARQKDNVRSFEDYSIDKYLGVFDRIYKGRVHILTLETIGFHFLEEVGEAVVAIRKLSQLRGIANDPNTNIDMDFLKQLTTIEGIVRNYNSYYKYPIDNSSRDPEMIRSRLVEAKMEMVIEIADTFSWFCAIMNKLKTIQQSMLDSPKEILKPLESILIDLYLDSDGNPICPTCGKKPCNCVFFY